MVTLLGQTVYSRRYPLGLAMVREALLPMVSEEGQQQKRKAELRGPCILYFLSLILSRIDIGYCFSGARLQRHSTQNPNLASLALAT